MRDSRALAIPHAGSERSSHSPRGRSWFQPVMMFIRRSHLYLGLLLTPWALLYGVTGYLFNHPSHFSDGRSTSFGREAFQGTMWVPLPSAADAAQQVVMELNQRFSDVELSLLSDEPPRYEGDFFVASAECEDRTVSVMLHRSGSGGSLREMPRPQARPEPAAAPFSVTPRDMPAGPGARGGRRGGPRGERSGGLGGREMVGREMGGSGAERSAGWEAAEGAAAAQPRDREDPRRQPIRIAAGLDQVVAPVLKPLAAHFQLEQAKPGLQLTSTPQLAFRAEGNGVAWDVRYEAASGAVTAERVDDTVAARPFSVRRMLTQLHSAHGYPFEIGPRWYWAVVVDLMSIVMVFWGVSGVVMWWQLRRLRWPGAAAMVVSLLAAGVLFTGMVQLLR